MTWVEKPAHFPVCGYWFLLLLRAWRCFALAALACDSHPLLRWMRGRAGFGVFGIFIPSNVNASKL